MPHPSVTPLAVSYNIYYQVYVDIATAVLLKSLALQVLIFCCFSHYNMRIVRLISEASEIILTDSVTQTGYSTNMLE